MTEDTEERLVQAVDSCSVCGRVRDQRTNPADALSWSLERERGVMRWLCPSCARTHVRDIEGKLPAEYW